MLGRRGRRVVVAPVVRARLGLRRAAREGQAQDRALHHPQLLRERADVVRQPVALADRLDPRRHLRVARARHVREQVVLDLVAEVAAGDVEERAALDVGRAHELAHVPRSAALVGHLVLAEGVGLVGEVAAEDDRVRPHVADHVGGQVRGQGRAVGRRAAPQHGQPDVARHVLALSAPQALDPPERLAGARAPAGSSERLRGQRGPAGHERADQRPGHVVLDDLRARLAGDALELLEHLLLGLLAAADGVEVEVVHGHAPLEQEGQQHVVDGLGQVDRMPLLVRVDPHDLVAEVAVLAADVRVGVVDVVVGVLPRLGRRGRVPVPGRGVDLGVVHPVPLAVQDVVADLHVLEDLGRRQRGHAQGPDRAEARGDEQRAAEHGEAAVQRDHPDDVLAVAVAQRLEHLVVNDLELASERLDLLRAQVRERALDGAALHVGSPCRQSSISTRPSGALMHVRTISPSCP